MSQRNDKTGKLHPIDFFSSSLSPSQRNYSAGQLETWGLVEAVRKWNTYLRAAPTVELITDHNPLHWLREQKDPRHTYARWLLELEEIPYVISYRPGSKNQLPDYLSRIPDLKFDHIVNDDSIFEDKLCFIKSLKDFLQIVEEKQFEDQVISIAVKQLGAKG